MEFMHRNGVMHRDLKPENIMYYRPLDAETLKILDFGLSSFIDRKKYPSQFNRDYQIKNVEPQDMWLQKF